MMLVNVCAELQPHVRSSGHQATSSGESSRSNTLNLEDTMHVDEVNEPESPNDKVVDFDEVASPLGRALAEPPIRPSAGLQEPPALRPFLPSVSTYVCGE